MTELQVRLELMVWPNLFKFEVAEAVQFQSVGLNFGFLEKYRKGIVLGETPGRASIPPYRNGAMTKDACCLEQYIDAECFRSIMWKGELCI